MICSACVTPLPLKKLIDDRGHPRLCRYCNEVGIAVSTQDFFKEIYQLVEENLATRDDLSWFEDVMLFECGSDETNVAGIGEVLAEWFNLGEEPYFDDLYAEVPTEYKNSNNAGRTLFFEDAGRLERNFYEDKWIKFITTISHSHRFFNSNAKEFLDSVFSFLCNDSEEIKSEFLSTISKGTPLYRARTAGSYEVAKAFMSDPAKELGPTPNAKASSQRMTPNGISALYCSFERETCLSEIRAITGDNVISIALTPITELKLLDLTKLDQVIPKDLTLLDRGYLENLHLQKFITTLITKLSKPKGSNGDLSYLPTQVFFEYLRLKFVGQVNGLVFPSVQTGGKLKNVVIFPEFSAVSSRNYTHLDDYELAEMREPDFVPYPEDPFEQNAFLYCISGSLRFHSIVSIATTANEFKQIEDLFMDDMQRQRFHRLGLS